MNELTPQQATWIAGLFEGEGCILLFPTRAEIKLSMTDFDVVYRLAELTGVGYFQTKQYGNPKHKRQLRWSITRKTDVFDFLRVIRPWLGGRRGDMADAALATITEHPQRWSQSNEQVNARQRERRQTWRLKNPEGWQQILARGRQRVQETGSHRTLSLDRV